MKATFRPLVWLDARTPANRRRSRSTFSASWSNTMGLLERELGHLGANEVVIEADFREQDIRIDGLPRSNAPAPAFPGIRITFNSKKVGTELRYQTDVCASWQHNVRSIALGLESLRAVDRYGITLNSEQYVGFKALPAGGDGAASHMTRTEADELLWEASGLGRDNPWSMEARFRKARARSHPDRNNGDRAMWDLVEQAGVVLGLVS